MVHHFETRDGRMFAEDVDLTELAGKVGTPFYVYSAATLRRHVKVMQDIDAKYGHGADENTHKILNQAMYDVAQALKAKNVKLASLH